MKHFLFCLLLCGCASPAKVTSVVNTDPATQHTSQTTIVEYKSWDVQATDTVAHWIWDGVKYVRSFFP